MAEKRDYNKIRPCAICGTRLKPWHRMTCSLDCRDRYARIKKAEYHAKERERVRKTTEDELEIKPWKPKAKTYKSPISDAEQFELNLALHRKLSPEKSDPVIYRKGTPEWDAVVAQITPLDKIPHQSYALSTLLRNERV